MILFFLQGTVQQYIDDLFLQILKVDHTLPPAVKYLFDFLDTAARRHNIVDAEVVHTWKSNRWDALSGLERESSFNEK